jgi:hypothetical protein
MSALYHDAQRRLQDQFDTRRLADRIEDRLVHDHLDEDDAAFITARDMFFLATVDPEGRPNCSYKGGDPGFVRVLDDRTLAFPNYDGNGMYVSMGNALATGQVSKFVPRKTGRPPVPDWKRSDWACDVLPEGDPAREPATTD